MFNEPVCTHPSTEIVKFTIANGQVRISSQCLECGERVGNLLSHAGVDIESLPWENAELRERKREEYRQRWDDFRSRERLLRDLDWWRKYEDYLKSDHWHNLRRVVLRRDGYRCQNCFRAITEATAHVHHLDYAGFNKHGYSFAFECTSLCYTCHTDYHKTEEVEEIYVPF